MPPAPPAKADRTGLMTLGGLLVSLSAVFAVLWINRPPTAEPVAAAMADALDQRPAGAGHRVPPVPPPPLPVKPKAPPKPPAPPQVQAPAPTPKPKQASVSPVPELPPTTVRPTEVAARKKTSEACIDWLRRRSLEPAGSERTSNPACE
ncbi:hypothetical protein [Sphaerotilus montanus]|uniref:hypothetical protein n=1 Tax=Sphaerotilus montanus TaxID=522889 RepID=UPI001C5CA447|nr:hypothetical protein [Sphaerotilus montanus]